MPGKQEEKKQGEMLTLAITTNSPFAPTRLFSFLPPFSFFLSLFWGDKYGGGVGGNDEGEGCLKEKEIKVVPHCKPQVFDFNLRGQTLRGICSA